MQGEVPPNTQVFVEQEETLVEQEELIDEQEETTVEPEEEIVVEPEEETVIEPEEEKAEEHTKGPATQQVKLAAQQAIESQSLGDPASLFTGSHLFITTWRTTTASEQIMIPTASSTSPLYNFEIDRGDGTTGSYVNIANPNPTHTYTVP